MISVIIPTYNRAKMVAACVASVLATNYPELEVIVVDDCSPDDTQGELRRRFGADPRVRIIRNERNAFQAVSRNNGARVARGEYLFFLDDDNLVHPSIFLELLAAFGAQSNVGLVAPLAIHQRPGRANVIWSLGSDFNRWTSQPKDASANLPLTELGEQPAFLPTTYYPNGFLISREVFQVVKGFDESFLITYEESDLGWRLIKAGYSNFIATKARTDHLGFIEQDSAPPLRLLGIEKPRRTYCFARNRLRFARRHFSFLQALSVSLIFAPLSAVYYCGVALKNHRTDIAWAYFTGTLAGIFGR